MTEVKVLNLKSHPDFQASVKFYFGFYTNNKVLVHESKRIYQIFLEVACKTVTIYSPLKHCTTEIGVQFETLSGLCSSYLLHVKL